MKKLLLIFCVALFAACGPRPRSRIVDTFFFDYRPFTQKGFFISPNMYTLEHESLGEFFIQVYPAKRVSKKTSYSRDDIYGTQTTTKLIREKITAEELLEIIVDDAKSRGADALVNFKFRWVENFRAEKGVVKDLSHYQISGFAIKRK